MSVANESHVTELYYAQIDFIERRLFQSRVLRQSALDEFRWPRQKLASRLFLYYHLDDACAFHCRCIILLQRFNTAMCRYGKL